MATNKELAPSTAAEIKKLVNLAFDEQDPVGKTVTEWLDSGDLKDLFENEEVQILMRFVEDELVALTIMGNEDLNSEESSNVEIFAIAVHPEHQGKGVGGEFLAAAERIAKQRFGAESLLAKLEGMSAKAQDFFVKYGFGKSEEKLEKTL